MVTEFGEFHYFGLALQELQMAASSTSLLLRANHLDAAARYATLRELSASPSRSDDESTFRMKRV
jgi:hypothetical protein